jgi:hypothetical protein
LKFKLFTYLASFLALSATIFILYIFVDGGNRYNGFRFIAESKNLVFESRLNRAISQQNFSRAANLLEERLNNIRQISNGNNTQTLDYFNILKKAFDSTIVDNEKKVFIDLLNKLNLHYPQNYQVKIMLAQAIKNNSYELALESIDEAIKLIGSHSEAYKLGIEIAFTNNQSLKLGEYCSLYSANLLGGIKFVDKDANQLQELGLRRFGLNIESSQQNFFIENNDIQLEKIDSYEFSFPSPIILKGHKFSLILPIISGVLLDISEIHFFSEGFLVQSLFKDSFILSAGGSFFNSDGELLLSNRAQPEVASLIFLDGEEDISVDKLIFKIKFSRQGLFSNPICAEYNSN